LPHFWKHTVGSCHAALALRADWQEHLRRCRTELGFRRVRFHGLLCDDMSTLVLHQGRKVCSFLNADRIVDFLLAIGMQPFVELSFMPTVLASGPQTVFHYCGNITPPREYAAWGDLVGQLTRHWVERYGAVEVRQWFFEVWNEPNLSDFWAGTRADYFELYRHAARAIKGVDPAIQVGGPATAKEDWIEEFQDYCDRSRLPADFISTHHYPNDVLWYEGQDTETQLANSKRGILREWMQKARQRVRGRPLFYTEWNCSSNPRFAPQDEPYAAAFIVKTILEAAGLVDCYSFWTFSDIFEENFFPSMPFHGGFGLLNLHGIPKPAYRAFELLSRSGNELLPAQGNHPTLDAWATRGPARALLFVTNNTLPRHPIDTERARLRLTGAPRPRAVSVERLDAAHGNAKRSWSDMGEPEYLTAPQIEQLQQASQLVREPLEWQQLGQHLEMEISLPPQAVAAITLDF
jgi:xylan 1,4-beta-xylosidase